ncbi:MAG: hypothetical protein BGO49_19730 [Planctomycetales bacterium 71-10]|nr:MAG: hypothetical protein BGO49_19730 [Planctomycetales bacterium 71-10]
MTAEEPLGVRATTLAMAAVATTTTALAIAEPGVSPARPLAAVAAWTAAAIAAHAWIGRHGKGRSATTAALLATSSLVPVAVAAARVAWTGRATPLEQALLCSLRNLALGLAAASHEPAAGRLAALASLFLVLASASIADGPAAAWALGAFAILGGVWLALAYWRGLRPMRGEGAPRRSPAGHLAGAFALVGLAVAVTAVGPTRAAVALAGLFPSSGGTDWNDPDARGGVGDGDDEVKGAENPQSIGFADSDAYLDTDRPSLYDAFNDMYGEPSKPKKSERMVALSNPNVVEQRERPAENLRANRQFSAVRRGVARRPGRPAHREAEALLYVDGPTPLHIGLAAYDRFDGRDWSEAARPNIRVAIEPERRAGPWFRIGAPDSRALGGVAAHRIKVAALDSAALPAPPLLRAFRMGEVDRVDFFGWAADGMIAMEGRTIPSSTVVETESAAPDPDGLASLDFPPRVLDADARPLGPAASAWLDAMTRGTPPGWARVEAIVRGLRRDAAPDPKAVAPDDCGDVVEHFAAARRGPDYLFATACAAMLRSSGHSARLVTGLYAAPSRYDAKTRHTPVRREDVHTWVEVRIPCGLWIPVEPTPGYELPGPSPAALAGIWAAFRSAAGRVAGRPVACATLAALALLAVRFRREAADALATLAWRASLRGPSRRGVIRTVALLELRARLVDAARPPGESLRSWYGPLAPAADVGRDLESLLALAEWSLYAPPDADAPSPAGSDPIAACRRAVRAWKRARFRRPSGNMKEST